MTATYKRVCAVIGDLAGIDPEQIAPAQALGQTATPNFYWQGDPPKPLALDSLDRVTLAMKLEDEFKIELPDEEVDDPALDHVGGLVAFVQGKLDAMFCPSGFNGAPEGFHAVIVDGRLTYRENARTVTHDDVGGCISMTEKMPRLAACAVVYDIGGGDHATVYGQGVGLDFPLTATATPTQTDEGAPDLKPALTNSDVIEIGADTFGLLAAQAEQSARSHAKRIFAAGFDAACQMIGRAPILGGEDKWREFAEREGLRP